MLTLFSTPKPFRGHIGTIQRNALRSWILLHPDVEVVLFGDDEGTAEVCRELGLRNEAHVERDEFGVKVVSYMFDRAQEIARHDYVCYSNCDIILPGTFSQALKQLMAWRPEFMMVGQRTDVDITESIGFDKPDWEQSLVEIASRHGTLRTPDWIDYFAFKRGLCTGMPPFAVGRPCWDNWLVWKMRQSRVAVVDASPVVVAVHQNHDYSHHPEGKNGLYAGKEFLRGSALAGSSRHLYTIHDAPYVLESGGIRRSYRHWGLQLERERKHLWHLLLGATRPARQRLGLRKGTLSHVSKADQ